MSTLVKLSAIAVSALLALPASAIQRTFIASFGNDANACTLTSPCRGFTRALTQTDANGEVIVLDSAGYGVFSITQSVSVIAPDGVYAGISVFPGQHGIVVNGAGIKVTLRGLTINGQGGDDGIRIVNAGDVFIEKVVIANTGNANGDAGIRVTATGSRVFVTNTTVRGGAGFGIVVIAPSGRLTIGDSLVMANGSSGVDVSSNAGGEWELTVARSIFDSNAGDAIVIGGGTNGTYRASLTDNVLRRNNFGGVFLDAIAGETATVMVGDNRIVGNTGAAGIECAGNGTGVLIAERNEVVGNFRGFVERDSCTLKTMGNNAVENNLNPDLGAPFTGATLR